MRKLDTNQNTKNMPSKLWCPACGQHSGYDSEGKYLQIRIEASMLPQPGSLTECDKCFTLLEFTGDCKALQLRQAPKARIQAFHKLNLEGPAAPKLSDILKYVKKYRQMPSDQLIARSPRLGKLTCRQGTKM